jgi:predicted metal-binding protein
MYKQVTPIIDYSVRELCCRPYLGHKKGCPNYCYKQGCPPQAQLFDKVFDLTQPVFAIYNAFDISSHVKKIMAANPGWSQRQLTCCLYWQNTARKQLTTELAYFMITHPDYHVAAAFYKGLDKGLGPLFKRVIPSPPEAMGVEITKTMAGIGVNLEWPPVNVAYQVALAGMKRV